MATWTGWDTALLHQLGYQPTRQNLQFLHAWQGHEGGSASFNPFNTTQSAPGASSYNSVGVRNYGSAGQGLAATVETLRNGRYGAILRALQSGNPTWTPALGEALSTWGTGSGFMQGYRSTPVPGPTPPVPGVPGPSGGPTGPAVRVPQGRVFSQQVISKINQGLRILHQQGPPMQGGQQIPLGQLPQFVPQTVAPGTKIPTQPNAKGPAPQTSALGAHIVQFAAQQIGQPYVWGGESRKEGGFDCSGLVDYALRTAGVNLPSRLTTYSAMNLGTSVKGQKLQPGDMVIVEGGKHMVLYAGGGKVIAAPHTGTVVQYQPLSQFRGSIVDVRRI